MYPPPHTHTNTDKDFLFFFLFFFACQDILDVPPFHGYVPESNLLNCKHVLQKYVYLHKCLTHSRTNSDQVESYKGTRDAELALRRKTCTFIVTDKVSNVFTLCEWGMHSMCGTLFDSVSML